MVWRLRDLLAECSEFTKGFGNSCCKRISLQRLQFATYRELNMHH